MKRNRSLNTTNGLLAKMESSYVTTCFGLHLWPPSGYDLVALRVYTICLKVGWWWDLRWHAITHGTVTHALWDVADRNLYVLGQCLKTAVCLLSVYPDRVRPVKLNIFSRLLVRVWQEVFNPLNPELNPICYLLALLGAHYFLHVSKIRVKLLTFRRLMSNIYGAPILDVSRSHTTT